MFIQPIRILITLGCLVAISGCASTSMTRHWVEDEAQGFRHIMIIGVSDSQQTRRIYENYFVEELNKHKARAIPSYRLISSKQKITRENVVNAIKGTDIDGVLVTYLVSADSEMKYQESVMNGSYSNDPENLLSSTLISTRGRSSTKEVINLKNDLYDVSRKKLVWSIQTSTVAPDSIDEVVVDLTRLLINQLQDDDLILSTLGEDS